MVNLCRALPRNLLHSPMANMDKCKKEIDQAQYVEEYSEESFWAKVGKFFVAAGREVVERALILKYVAESPDTPMHAKVLIYTALGYFILPIDAIPDLTPLIGFADDLGALLMALAAVALYITPEIRERARKKSDALFGVDRQAEEEKAKAEG